MIRCTGKRDHNAWDRQRKPHAILHDIAERRPESLGELLMTKPPVVALQASAEQPIAMELSRDAILMDRRIHHAAERAVQRTMKRDRIQHADLGRVRHPLHQPRFDFGRSRPKHPHHGMAYVPRSEHARAHHAHVEGVLLLAGHRRLARSQPRDHLVDRIGRSFQVVGLHRVLDVPLKPPNLGHPPRILRRKDPPRQRSLGAARPPRSDTSQ